MFMIEMLIYTLVAYQPIAAPQVYISHASFPTIEQCIDHLKSGEFATERALAVVGTLQKYVAEHDEDGVRAGVTATASCVDDPRL